MILMDGVLTMRKAGVTLAQDGAEGAQALYREGRPDRGRVSAGDFGPDDGLCQHVWIHAKAVDDPVSSGRQGDFDVLQTVNRRVYDHEDEKEAGLAQDRERAEYRRISIDAGD